MLRYRIAGILVNNWQVLLFEEKHFQTNVDCNEICVENQKVNKSSNIHFKFYTNRQNHRFHETQLCTRHSLKKNQFNSCYYGASKTVLPHVKN